VEGVESEGREDGSKGAARFDAFNPLGLGGMVEGGSEGKGRGEATVDEESRWSATERL